MACAITKLSGVWSFYGDVALASPSLGENDSYSLAWRKGEGKVGAISCGRKR